MWNSVEPWSALDARTEVLSAEATTTPAEMRFIAPASRLVAGIRLEGQTWPVTAPDRLYKSSSGFPRAAPTLVHASERRCCRSDVLGVGSGYV
jgi:hypothetical protein